MNIGDIVLENANDEIYVGDDIEESVENKKKFPIFSVEITKESNLCKSISFEFFEITLDLLRFT